MLIISIMCLCLFTVSAILPWITGTVSVSVASLGWVCAIIWVIIAMLNNKN